MRIFMVSACISEVRHPLSPAKVAAGALVATPTDTRSPPLQLKKGKFNSLPISNQLQKEDRDSLLCRLDKVFKSNGIVNHSEIYSLYRDKMYFTSRSPPAHHWYAAKSPGLSLQCRSSRALQTALASFKAITTLLLLLLF
ncbi:hypothetical protein TNCV_711981 [Trichonephila clavipes]|nr:hypothetical protein TNCV_711981 [Trichonephila clavipes]